MFLIDLLAPDHPPVVYRHSPTMPALSRHRGYVWCMPTDINCNPPVPRTMDQSFTFGTFWLALTNRDEPSDAEMGPVTVLGHEYETLELAQPEIDGLVQLTYRYGFEPIPRDPTGPSPLAFLGSLLLKGVFSVPDLDAYTSDVGWGCMIRTSQTLLATALLRSGTGFERVVDMFQDRLDSPYSLHNFTRVAGHLPLQVKPGQWFGPDAASLSILRLCKHGIRVALCESGDIAIEEVNEPTLLLLPVRLGIELINPYYHASLLHMLSLPQLVGIAGGKPRASYYFFGHHGDDLLYLDPHSPQEAQPLVYESYRPRGYQRGHVSTLDPLMMIGFYVQNQQDFEDLKTACKDSKIVHFSDGRKGYDFVHVPRMKRDDEFVDIGPGDDDDFVDLGSGAPSPPPEADDLVVVLEEEETPSVHLEEYELAGQDK